MTKKRRKKESVVKYESADNMSGGLMSLEHTVSSGTVVICELLVTVIMCHSVRFLSHLHNFNLGNVSNTTCNMQ